LESSRQLISFIRTHSLSQGLPQRTTTVATYFYGLRELLRWMDDRGYTRFEQLDAVALVQFKRHVADRRGRSRTKLAAMTVLQYLYLFVYLYRFRDRIGDGILNDPFAGRSASTVAGVRDGDAGRLPYTPDAVAVPLVQHAMNLVLNGSEPILKARTLYAQTMAAASAGGVGIDWCTVRANRALRNSGIEITSIGRMIATVADLSHSIDMLYAACFVTLSYLVGPRVSEILHLEADCAQMRGEGHDAVCVIVGAIFKRQPEYQGRPHEWVAPPAAVQAIHVLERLSAGHRARTGRAQLWLRGVGTTGAREWEYDHEGELRLASRRRVSMLLERLSKWLDLPLHEGKMWRFSTHQGRKTFARFVALRDRSSLFALAQQLGHRERAVTDQGYSGSDYRLTSEIEAEVLESSVAAWEEMLASESLGGRGGAEITSKRPRFKGAKLKQDLKSYARMLVDAGLTLGVCDWGFCVYREELSACLGSKWGPNSARREPSTCVSCKNFCVSASHRAYWAGQFDRHHALLNEPSLPLQTLREARKRMEEAREIIRHIDGRQDGQEE
jgi:integrase